MSTFEDKQAEVPELENQAQGIVEDLANVDDPDLTAKATELQECLECAGSCETAADFRANVKAAKKLCQLLRGLLAAATADVDEDDDEGDNEAEDLDEATRALESLVEEIRERL